MSQRRARVGSKVKTAVKTANVAKATPTDSLERLGDDTERPLSAFEQRLLALVDPREPSALERLRQQPVEAESRCCSCASRAMCGGLRCWGYCLCGVVAVFVACLAVIFVLVGGARFAYWYANKPWPGPL